MSRISGQMLDLHRLFMALAIAQCLSDRKPIPVGISSVVRVSRIGHICYNSLI